MTPHPPSRLTCYHTPRASRATHLHALPAFTRCPPSRAARLHTPPAFTRHPPSRATRLHAPPAFTPHPPSRLTRLTPPLPPSPHLPSPHPPSRLTRLHAPPAFTPHPPAPATAPLHASPAYTRHTPPSRLTRLRLTCLRAPPAFARHPPSPHPPSRLTRHHTSPAFTPHLPSHLTCHHAPPACTRHPPARAACLHALPAFTPHPPSRLTHLHASPAFTPHPPSRLTRLHASPAFTCHPPSRATRLHVPPAFMPHLPSRLTCLHASPAFTPHPPSRLTRHQPSPPSRLTCDEIKYIVPALLTKPIAPPSSLSSETCCLVLHFELADRFPAKRNLVVKEAALNKGFLPQGLIHHLFGSAAGWTYHTTDGLEPRLGRGSAHVSFGLQQLVLEHVRRQPFLIRCTIVGIGKDSVGGAAYAACNRLRLLTDQVMQRFPALRYRMLLPLRSARDTLIDVQQLAAAGDVAVFVRDQPWNINRVKEELSVWLRPPTPPSLYDCFFSYSHHGAFDSPFIQRVHDATTVWCHVAFLDQYSLKPGVDLAFACMLAIVNSRLLVPLISWSSLRRLSVLTTDSECNYYLLELTLIVLLKELYEVPVLPIFVGASDTDGSPDASADLFACRPPKASTYDGLSNELDKATNKPVHDSRIVFDRMPTVAVRTVTEQIRRFFERQGKEVPPELANLTVNAVVNKLRGSKGVVTWKSSSSHSGSRKQHWGLEMRVAEEVHYAIEATPPELPKLKFAKPAHPGEQDKAFEQLARDMKEMKSDIKEVKSDIKEVKSDVKEVKSDVKVVLHLSEAHFKLLSTLLKGADRLAPKLICFLPTKFKEKGKLLDLIRHPKAWFSQRVRVFFVDPISLTLANTNGGDGFELVFPKDWVTKALPYVKVGLTVLKVAAVAGKLAGFPAIPDLKAVMGEWVDSQLEAVNELRSHGLHKMEEMMGGQQFAEELLGKVEEQCAEMLTDTFDEARMSKGNELSKMLQEPLQKSLRELDNLLKQQHPNWKEQCGLVLAVAQDGSIEWVLPEHVEEFTMKGALFRMGKSLQ
ncbi:hypothetical protein AB1Y20_017113 [Prymnesium parvum]